MSTAAVEVHDLTKTYRDLRRRATHALADVTLSVESGTIFGLLGQNGAGKTSLVKILLGLSWPSAGNARVLGNDPANAHARRRIGYLPEQMRLPEYLRADGFLRFMGRLSDVRSSSLNERIPRLLEQVGLSGVRKRLKAYSKGMQQRLGLAQSLINDPELILLDEPTEGLDPLGRKQVRDLLVSLRSQGKTIFLNSHLLSEIELVCDQVLILDHGRVARAGAPGDFTRATGEYRIRVADASPAARAAVESVVGSATWEDAGVRFMPRDREQLNALIDKLRAAPVEIEAIEPVHSTLEEFFIEVVAGRET
jgi:ABC-2 type transport system ATP-binding protein